ADSDLRDQEVVRGEAELSADRLAVEAGMEALDVGAGVDHLDLPCRRACRHEITLDRRADRDDRVHAPARVSEAARAGHVEADAAIEDQPRARPPEPGAATQG